MPTDIEKLLSGTSEAAGEQSGLGIQELLNEPGKLAVLDSEAPPAEPVEPPKVVYPKDWSKDEEDEFKPWYETWADTTKINPDPDDPRHFYDYREAYRNKVTPFPDEEGVFHWPSEFKKEGHPNLVVDGINTKTGEPAGVFTPITPKPVKYNTVDELLQSVYETQSAVESTAFIEDPTRIATQMYRAVGQGAADTSKGIEELILMDKLSTPEEFEKRYGRPPSVIETEQLKSRADFLRNEPAIRQAFDTFQEAYPELLPGKPKMLEQVLTAPMAFAPSMVASAMSGGLGFGMTFLTIFGQAEREYEKQGVPEERRHAAALFNALGQTPIEFAGNMIQIRGVFKLLKASKIGQSVDKTLLDFAQVVVQNAVGEGLEEYLQQYVQEASNYYAANPGMAPGDIAAYMRANISKVHLEALKAGGVGALSGGLMAGMFGAASLSDAALAQYRIDPKQQKFSADVRKLLEEIATGETAEEAVPKEMGATPGVGVENAPDLVERDREIPEEGAEVPDFTSLKEAEQAGAKSTDEEVTGWQNARQQRLTEAEFFTGMSDHPAAMRAIQQAKRFERAIAASEDPERFVEPAQPETKEASIEESIKERGKPFDFEDPQDYKWLKSLGYNADEIYYASQMPGVYGRVKTRKLQEPSELPGTTPPVYAAKKEASIEPLVPTEENLPRGNMSLGAFEEFIGAYGNDVQQARHQWNSSANGKSTEVAYKNVVVSMSSTVREGVPSLNKGPLTDMRQVSVRLRKPVREASIELAPETKAQMGLFKEKKAREKKVVEKWIQTKDEEITDQETGKKSKAIVLTPEAEKALHKAGVQTGAGPFRTGSNFVVSITEADRGGVIYGPARASDKKTTRTKDLLTGKETITEYWRTIEGKEFKVLNTPIMPKTKEARVKLMDKLVNEFKKDLTWYTDWREFMTAAEGQQPDQAKIDKLMKIQVILSAGASPQGAQTAYGKLLKRLEEYGTVQGGEGQGTTGVMAEKVNRVWQGLDKDIVTLEDMQKAYGPKIGAMMFAALHPMAREGGIVVDRHIARLWGYNAMWGGSFRVPGWLQQQVVDDITETARRMDLPVAAVQAALWYSSGAGHWGSATRFEEAIRIAPKKSLGHEMAHLITMEPQAITSFRGHLYFTLHGATMPVPLTMAEKTRLGDLEFKVRSLNFAEDQLTPAENAELLALQHKQEGTKPSSWSKDDVQKRMDASTNDNKYASLTYWYGPGVRRESFFWGKEPHLTRVYQDEIYNAIEDRLGYKDIAWQRALNDTDVKAGRRNASDVFMNALANTIAKAGKTPEGRDFKGFALEENGNTWMFTFDDMVVEEHPVEVDVGLSDLVANTVELPTDLQDLADVSSSRAARLIDHLQAKLKDYPVTVQKLVPTIARFGDVTSGEAEYGVALRVRGPISAIRAAFSDVIGLQRHQNSVILIHQSGATNGKLLTFKLESEDLKSIQKSLLKYEISDFNLRYEGDGWTFQTFVSNDMEDAQEFVDKILKLYENKGVAGSLTHTKARGEMLTREKTDETYPTDYQTHILSYYGKTKGGEVYDRSTKAGGEWSALSALLSGTEAARSGVKRESHGTKRSIRDGFREPAAKKPGPEAEALIAGVYAQSALNGNLQKAAQLEAEHKSSDEIWKQTGWIRGAEGLWRFEIDDTKAMVRDTTLWKDKASRPRLKNNWPDPTWTTPITLGRIFEHKVLFGYYPALRDVKVEVDRSPGAVGASYNPETKTIEIAAERFKDGADLIESVFHETQHAIQDIEGFAMGSSPYLEYMRLKADPKYKGWGVNRLAKLAEENYLKEAGEIESMDVTDRLMLTSQERKRTTPYSSAQVEMDKWLIRRKGTSFSVKKDAAISLIGLKNLQAPTAVAQMIQDALAETGLGNYTEVLKRLQVLFTPKITLKMSDLSAESAKGNAQALGITLKQLEEGMNKGLYQTAGLSEVTDSMHALITLALNGRSLDKVKQTTFHELWHVAERWIIPEAALDKLKLLVPDREERANLFKDYVTKRMTAPQPTWMQKVWNDILMFLQTLRGGLTSMNITSAEQVFENTILGKYQPHFGTPRLIDKKNGVWASPELIKDLDDMESGPANITSIMDGENQFAFEDEKTAKKHISAMVDNWHKMEPQMFGFMYPENTKTPQFEEWFGKSVVTDRKTGLLPLQVYHGTHTSAEFTAFKDEQGRAGWFSEHPELTTTYATDFANHARVLPVYLRIENPFRLIINIDDNMRPDDFHKEAGLPGKLDDWFPKQVSDTALWLRSKTSMHPLWAYFKEPALTDHLKKHGFDGVYATERNQFDTWLAFDPKQVKSVFNPGTWSRQDSDIMASIEENPTWVPPKGQSQSEADLTVPGIIELPEMLEIVKLLTGGKIPGVREKLFGKDSIRGVFMPGHGIIRLKADIFKDPFFAAKILAHEIGHLVDWLPDHLIKGTILGKIASIRDFVEKVLPYKPGAPGALTAADTARLRAEAIQLLGMVQAVRTKWIDTTITTELKVTAEDLLNIWNAVEKAKLFSPELYKYIAGLDANAKKMIAKAALKGMVPLEVEKFAKQIKGAKTKTQVTEVVYVPPSQEAIAKKLAELLEKEIRLRKLWVEEEVRDELKTLSARWRPFDPTESKRFTQYRWSSAELYADAISVLFNDPAFLKAQAPKFYEAFFNYLDSKREVKQAYIEIQRQLHSGEVDKRRTENYYRMFDEGNAAYAMQYEDMSPNISDALKRDFIDTFHFILKDVRKIGDANIPVNNNPRYKLEDMVYTGSEIEGFTTDLYTNVIKPLEAANLKWDREFGLLTMLRRIAIDRSGLAQPGGFDAEKAINKMEAMKNVELKPEQWTALKLAVTNFRALHEKYFIDKAEKAQIYDDALIKRFRDNTSYATFDVLSYLIERYGHSVATRVYQQVGTLQDISNPATATIMKDIAFIKSVNKNTAVRTTVKFYQDYASVLGIEVKEADKAWNGRFRAIQPPKDKKMGLVVYLHKGKAYGYYLPKDIASALNDSTTKYASTARIFRWLSQPMRQIFTQVNYGFWIFNAFFRDAQRMVMTLPGFRVDKFMKHWLSGLKPAFRSTFGIPDDVVQQMQRDHMLISIANLQDVNDEDQQIERLLKMFHMKGPTEYHNKILKPFGHMFNWISNRARLAGYYFVQTGQALERTTKVGSYTYLKEKFPDMPTPVLAHLVRNAGSPDFLRAGREQALYNNILLFSNAMKEGYRGDIEAFKDHPGEYLVKKFTFMAVPKVLMYAGLIGFLGGAVKDIFKGVTEYDLTNYLIIPLGRTKSGKSVYWRIPTDEASRLLGGILWKILRAPELGVTHEAGDLFDYMAGQAPTVSPVLGVIADTLDYASGKNPYDRFYGRHAVGEVEFAAKDMRAHLQFLKYIAGKLGASIVYKFKHDKVEKVAEELESVIGFPISSQIADFAIKSVDAPVASNLLGRFLKVTDYGIRETILREKKEIKRENARGILDAREAAYAIVQGETPDNKQLLALAQKPDVVDRAMMLSLARKYGMLYFEEWMSAGSMAEKFAVIKVMMEQNALSYKDVTGRDAPPPSVAPTAPAPSSEYPGLNIQEKIEKETRQ